MTEDRTIAVSGRSRAIGLSRRELLAGAAALAMAPGLAGSALAQDSINMRVSWWGSDDRHKKTLEIIKIFEKKNPGVTITPEYGGFVGYQDKLSTEFAGGNAPDVMQVADPAELIAAGKLLVLDDYVNSGKIDLSDANKTVLATSRVDGKLYSIPWGLGCGCWFLDTKVFADSNIELPGLNWTWDKFAEIARALSKANPGMYGAADIWAPAGTRALAAYEVFLRQRGKFAFTNEGQLGFDKADLTEWFTFWDELRRDGAIPPAAITALESGFETSPIVTGKTAMYPINSSIASSLQGLAKNKLVIRTFPNGIGSKLFSGPTYGQFINASMMIYVNTDTKYLDQSIKFVDFVTNDADAAKVHLMARGVPLSAKMAALVMPDISPIEQSMVKTVQYVQEHAGPDFVPWPTTGTQIQDLMQRMHQEFAYESSTVDQAVAKFFSEAARIMAD